MTDDDAVRTGTWLGCMLLFVAVAFGFLAGWIVCAWGWWG